ncbi:hypothetical protein HPULCUR_003617 [Helicostylum pulchrum]|uniref:C2H2-type domain-containing protein n=1 Tax=Helicostylum pulchrum TaxID=562976 RepID=A0ABP9XVZ6_9FUNG
MKQKANDVKSNAFNLDSKTYRPQTRGYIKQETEDSKEPLTRALYSPVKIEPPPLEMSKHKSNLSTGIINRQYVHVRGITLPDAYSEPNNFDSRNHYCKVCDMEYKHSKLQTIAHLRDIHHTEPPSPHGLIPDTNDPDNYCAGCDKAFSARKTYVRHLVSAHLDKMPELYQGIDRKNPSKEDMRCQRYCADFQKSFLLKQSHQIHMDKIHGIKVLEHLTNSEGPDVDNPNNHYTSCDKTYSFYSRFRRHLVYLHNLPVPRKYMMINDVVPVFDRSKKYCNVCNRVYKSLQSY